MGQAVRVVSPERVTVETPRGRSSGSELIVCVKGYVVHGFFQRLRASILRSVDSNGVGIEKAFLRGQQTCQVDDFNVASISTLEEDGVEDNILFGASCPPVDRWRSVLFSA